MRLWHKDLIPYLPRKQLIAQWRECCAICSNWANKGTPNHLLVNKVMNYPTVHFMEYTRLVISEMIKRNYKANTTSLNNFIDNFCNFGDPNETIIGANTERVIFEDWHNERYLKQCLFNLQEKYDCGGISDEEWKIITDKFGESFEFISLKTLSDEDIDKIRHAYANTYRVPYDMLFPNEDVFKDN